jgi:UDP-N-acetyl-2-amino-2-deoxyglucuronate dehydrogenase
MSKTYNFGLTGAAGYIAPRHLKAIKETGNTLLAALDPNDSVGIMDSYFPDADFFTEPERFDRHLDKLRRVGKEKKIDYLAVCTPNYLHDAHIRMALRNDAHAICEKPIVLNPWNIDALQEIEKESGKNIFTILQLRLHPAIIDLKKRIESGPKDKVYDVDLTYITSRGRWYFQSWKGYSEKSGGVATNIGVHFFDMLSWVFGKPKENLLHAQTPEMACGFLYLENARIRWFLSVNSNHIPSEVLATGKRTFRSLTIENEEFEFSDGFTDLHTRSYEEILKGNGFSLEHARQSIELVHELRHATPIGVNSYVHPFLRGLK